MKNLTRSNTFLFRREDFSRERIYHICFNKVEEGKIQFDILGLLFSFPFHPRNTFSDFNWNNKNICFIKFFYSKSFPFVSQQIKHSRWKHGKLYICLLFFRNCIIFHVPLWIWSNCKIKVLHSIKSSPIMKHFYENRRRCHGSFSRCKQEVCENLRTWNWSWLELTTH